METKEKETELIQLIRQLRDYVILDRVILLYVCFTILPLWAAISLIGIKLAIPIAELVKYIIIAKKLIKDDKDANKKILSIRLKLANLKK